MEKFLRIFFSLTLIFFVFACSEKSKKEKAGTESENQKTENILQEDIVKTDSLPSIGKWMYTSGHNYANWLGAKLNGKEFREPINIVIIDSVSKSIDEAKNNLIKNFDKAGFEVRAGHSGGYLGYIENKFYEQLPDKSGHAFSDAPFTLNNSHGRIFGPCEIKGVYYFSGALSKEKVVINIPFHHYDSFNEARNKLAKNLNMSTNYKFIGYVNLFNAIDSDTLTTGDHDGKGVLISVIK